MKDDLDQWIYSFKNNEVPDDFKAPGIDEMAQKLDFLSMPKEKQRKYKKHLEDLASYRGTMSFAKKEAKEEGRIEERIKQERIREEERIKQERLREEEQRANCEKIVILAKELLKSGLSITKVSSLTGLSNEDIEKLL